MKFKKNIFLYIITFFLLFSLNSQAQLFQSENEDSIRDNILFLQRYLSDNNVWRVSDSTLLVNVNELIYFIQRKGYDKIAGEINSFNFEEINFIERYPQDVADTLNIDGYITNSAIKEAIFRLRNSLTEEFMKNETQVPVGLLTNLEEKAKIIPQEEGMRLFTDSVYQMPDSLLFLDAIPDSMVQSAEDFQRILKLDSIRDAIVEQHRIQYNDSIIAVYRDSVLSEFRNEALENLIDKRTTQYTDSVKEKNRELVEAYNLEVIKDVNDSIRIVLDNLLQYANVIDTVDIKIGNLFDEYSAFTLGGRNQQYSRLWLKNQQNDSISILISNPEKRRLKILIDDNITFSRISQQQTKEFQIENINPSTNLQNIAERFQVRTPWSIGGDGTVGFTQTYLSNWKKGGQSAVSMLLVLKGFANYSALNNKIKWENSVEIRNGWIQPGGKDENGERYESQKNDDKFEFISRIGVSAFKKWYYSAEIDFQTQFFNGYKYPTSVNPEPISAFMAPSKTLFKLGLDYKPNNNLSIFLSPITSKTVFVRDTIKINKSNFNIPDGKRSLWIPGLNAEIKYKTDLTSEISYETKYKMFMNYKKPFEKFDVDWENLFVMKLNDYINMRLMFHLIYDDDVLFPVLDEQGNEIDKKPKLQVKELFTVGFSYKINKKIYKARKVN